MWGGGARGGCPGTGLPFQAVSSPNSVLQRQYHTTKRSASCEYSFGLTSVGASSLPLSFAPALTGGRQTAGRVQNALRHRLAVSACSASSPNGMLQG